MNIDKIKKFLSGKTWEHLLITVAIVGLIAIFLLTNPFFLYEKGKGFSCGSKSNVNVDVKK
jgi:hypothetical protein